MNRREMLKLTGAAAVAATGMGRKSARGFEANDTIRVACIGVGARCLQLVPQLATLERVRIVGLCDVWDGRLDHARRIVPDAETSKDYRHVLDRKDVDAVLIATPDHWHVPMTVEACAAGKDVYVEKPLTHDLAEGDTVIQAKNKHQRIVQVGTQQRSMPHLIQARELVRAGRLGKVHKAHLTWNRNQPRGERSSWGVKPETVDWKMWLGNTREQPFDEYRMMQWRWFWDFGGGMFTDLMVHWLDTVCWMLDLDHPAQAVSVGDKFRWPEWETPDTAQTILHYPDAELQIYFEGTFFNRRHRAMTELMGGDATLYFDRGRYELHPEGENGTYEELILGEKDKGRGADFYISPNAEKLHLQNWLDCIRDRKPPAVTVEAGVRAAAGAHLANQALRNGGLAHWPAEAKNAG